MASNHPFPAGQEKVIATSMIWILVRDEIQILQPPFWSIWGLEYDLLKVGGAGQWPFRYAVDRQQAAILTLQPVKTIFLEAKDRDINIKSLNISDLKDMYKSRDTVADTMAAANRKLAEGNGGRSVDDVATSTTSTSEWDETAIVRLVDVCKVWFTEMNFSDAIRLHLDLICVALGYKWGILPLLKGWRGHKANYGRSYYHNKKIGKGNIDSPNLM
ncbi:hypothetical protein COCMIDRAFT_31194 [Bipolaris oryzae ATCC 44560]|uniref:WW domain-containing protein n=1 Tax=Bipolaris oryzae ATCC 44560 TaxID=930090 RepID=W6Z7Q8_COCMI|nr:uncharacterized protein COCMIDRAFT_31194 [Bipolaris oryzae ATCC 44560]EUC39706.1 hypothetical protein COCMIDRAFT_31194 [Bipolaris oryzae ATCC 44560]